MRMDFGGFLLMRSHSTRALKSTCASLSEHVSFSYVGEGVGGGGASSLLNTLYTRITQLESLFKRPRLTEQTIANLVSLLCHFMLAPSDNTNDRAFVYSKDAS